MRKGVARSSSAATTRELLLVLVLLLCPASTFQLMPFDASSLLSPLLRHSIYERSYHPRFTVNCHVYNLPLWRIPPCTAAASYRRHRRLHRQLYVEPNIESSAESSTSLPSNTRSSLDQWRKFASKNFFLCGMLFSLCMARAFPWLGVDGGLLRPELIIGQWGVALIFLLSGWSLELSQLTQALSNVKLNFMVQFASFGVWPLLVGLPLQRGLPTILPNSLPQPLLDGLLILTTLPTTVNMCVILTSAAGGNVASALCNAVIGNVAGIFLTPALLKCFLGSHIDLPLIGMLKKLSTKVLLPVIFGQMLRTTKPLKSLYESNAKFFKRLQEIFLLSILWNAFCNAITNDLGIQLSHAVALMTLLPALHLLSLGALFAFFSLPAWQLTRGQIVSAMFTASHKTLAFGLPLVHTVFAGSPHVALYSTPIMFIHPIQLIIGSVLIPRLTRYTQGTDDSESLDATVALTT